MSQLDGVNHGVFLTVPNTGLGEDEARNEVIENFLDAYENSGQRVVILEGGLTATTFSQSAIDAQVLDVERITRNRVATVYNIPPPHAGRLQRHQLFHGRAADAGIFAADDHAHRGAVGAGIQPQAADAGRIRCRGTDSASTSLH